MLELISIITIFLMAVIWFSASAIQRYKVEIAKRDIIKNGIDFEYIRKPGPDEIMVVRVDVGNMAPARAEAYMQILMEKWRESKKDSPLKNWETMWLAHRPGSEGTTAKIEKRK